MDQHTDQPGGDRTRLALEEFAARSSMLARQFWLDQAAVSTLEAFRAAGVDALVLKGIALSRLLYTAGEHRSYYDVDVMVAPRDLPEAGQVLKTLGYQNVSELDGVVDVAGILHAQSWSKSVVGYGNVTIDLHWRLAGCDASSQVVWEALTRNRGLIDVAESQLPTLSLSGLALHLALHAAQHGPEDVKALGDLRRGIDRWPIAIWREAADRAREVGAVNAFSAGLRLLARGAELAEQALQLPSADVPLWEIAHRDSRPRGTFHLKALADARSFRERILILRLALFPSRQWMSAQYRWARRGRPRLFGAYLVHILRSPLWALRAWRYRRHVKRLPNAS